MKERSRKLTVCDGVVVGRFNTCENYREKRVNDKSR